MNSKRGSAFTLVELLVVIGIIAILMSILLTALEEARSHANRIKCASNLRQLALGMLMYASDNDGFTPCWGWQFEESQWWDPTPAQKTKFVQGGLIWKYCPSRAVYTCPDNPRSRKGLYGSVNGLWGFPPYWCYVVNGQPGYSLRDPAFLTKIYRIRPSPNTVCMLMEESDEDVAAFDNGVILVHPTFLPGDDSLGDYHSHGGNMAFFDGRIEWMLRKEYIKRVSTVPGTLNLMGGYHGPDFYW